MKIFILLVLKHQNQNKSDVLLKWGITHIYLFTGLFYVYHQKYFKAYIKSKNFFFFFLIPHITLRTHKQGVIMNMLRILKCHSYYSLYSQKLNRTKLIYIQCNLIKNSCLHFLRSNRSNNLTYQIANYKMKLFKKISSKFSTHFQVQVRFNRNKFFLIRFFFFFFLSFHF